MKRTCLVLLTLVGCAQPVAPLPAAAPRIVVEAVYPGANATVVADTVAAPIEEQLKGLDAQLTSRCTDTGGYRLALTFPPGTDLLKTLVRVQDRVNVALPVLPEEVRRAGVSVKRKSAAPVVLLALTGKELPGAAVREELARVPGVGDVTILGPNEPAGLTIQLRPDDLARHGVTVADVLRVLQNQQVQPAAGQIAPPQLNLPGRAEDRDNLLQLVVKTGVPLGNLGEVQVRATTPGATWNGKPAVVLAVYANGDVATVRQAVAERVPKLKLPEGTRLDLALAAEVVRLDLDPPARVREVLAACATVASQVAGVGNRLTLTESPFGLAAEQPCLLVDLLPAKQRQRAEVGAALRAKLREALPDVPVRLAGAGGDFVLSGPDAEQVRKLADALVARLEKEKELSEVALRRECVPRPELRVDVDRATCQALGVALTDVFQTVQVFLGEKHLTEVGRGDRISTVRVHLEAHVKAGVEDLRTLLVRDRAGKMVPLGRLANPTLVQTPPVVVRLDGRPALRVSVMPATDGAVRPRCEVAFATVRRELRLPDDYRLTWPSE